MENQKGMFHKPTRLADGFKYPLQHVGLQGLEIVYHHEKNSQLDITAALFLVTVACYYIYFSLSMITLVPLSLPVLLAAIRPTFWPGGANLETVVG